MKDTTKKYLDSIVTKFNMFANKEAFDEMLNQSYMLCSALNVLSLEGIAEVKIIHDNPHKMFSTVHLIVIDKEVSNHGQRTHTKQESYYKYVSVPEGLQQGQGHDQDHA